MDRLNSMKDQANQYFKNLEYMKAINLYEEALT